MAGAFQSIWRLMRGDTICSADMSVHNGLTKLSLSLRRVKQDELFVVLDAASPDRNEYVVFEPKEFQQFVAAIDVLREALRREQTLQS
jgi:hypothetical protein